MKDNMPQVARYWNDIASNFDAIYSGEKSAFGRAMDKWLRKDIYQRYDWVMEKSGNVRGKSVCDLGCGSGRFVAGLAKKGAAKVTGVDIAPDMIKLASQLVEKEGVGDVCNLIVSDLLNWKADQQYDLSIAIGFWDYIQHPPQRLRIIRQATRGTFLSAWPRLWTWRMPTRKVRLAVDGCPVYFFRKGQIRKMLKEAGFEMVSCQVVGKLYCVEARPI